VTGSARYTQILRTPHVAGLLLASLVARMPIGIGALAIVLFLREERGSYAAAGLAAAAFALGAVIGGPACGRLVDRFGQRAVLLPMAFIHAVGLGALVVLGRGAAPLGVVIATALVAGSAIPPISAVLRPLWPELLHRTPELVPTAYALDSVVVELVFIGGPLLTAIATALVAPEAALLLAGALVLVGTVGFVASPPSRAWRPHPEAGSHGVLGALRSPGIRTLMAAMIPIGFCLGATEVTLPAFSEDVASRAWAGVLLAVWSLGSAFGGLWYGARDRGSALGIFLRMSVLVPLGTIPLALAPSLGVMLGLCLIAGVAIAPLIASANLLVAGVAPTGALTEAYTWPLTALIAGIAIGSAVNGHV